MHIENIKQNLAKEEELNHIRHNTPRATLVEHLLDAWRTLKYLNDNCPQARDILGGNEPGK